METFRKIAVGDKLKAIDVCLMDTEKEALIIGKEYEVRERGKDEEGEYILIYSEIGEHTFDIDELSEFFDVEPTPSREAEYREVLNELVQLKDHKDKFGKSPHYLENQPKAWEKAKLILNKQ